LVEVRVQLSAAANDLSFEGEYEKAIIRQTNKNALGYAKFVGMKTICQGIPGRQRMQRITTSLP
jgi:hypothetical protein